MAVLPINSVSVNANQYAFTGKNKKDSHNKANSLASVPVIVMLAMAPMAEGKQPAQFVPINSEHLTELVAATNAYAPAVEAYSQAPQEKAAPLGINFFRRHPILQIINAKANNKDVKMIFGSYPTKNNIPDKVVDRVFLIDKDYANRQIRNTIPPKITELIYHNTPEGEFCSVTVLETVINKNGNSAIKISNLKLDDNSAQELINLLAGETKWKNITDIKFQETTSSELKPTVII